MRSLQDWLRYVDQQADAVRRRQEQEPPPVDSAAEPASAAGVAVVERPPSEEATSAVPAAAAPPEPPPDELAPNTAAGATAVQAVLTFDATAPISGPEPTAAARRATGFPHRPAEPASDGEPPIRIERPITPVIEPIPPEPETRNGSQLAHHLGLAHSPVDPVESPAGASCSPTRLRPAEPTRAPPSAIPPGADTSDVQELWNRVPRHIQWLVSKQPDEVAQNSYKKAFRDTREQLIRRLMDPELTLEEVARVLGVCPTTVRRYTNRGKLNHHRTAGNQRRFRLSDVLEFLEANGPIKDYNINQDPCLEQ